ncbi:unnamed protein product [Spirodela intermedia]|uniref:Auxin-responsive protein n=2 Tax=Spirodela intermedia TaxID=51605 RepID=A0A7I8LGE8_SPIIN|nr:unnamed protein product [Spirodela intermedia]CAA6671633.1 unnamed protein product [Spirodela intermedia]CAA7408736.1 unnamed protein product [Spirodela intermedia]
MEGNTGRSMRGEDSHRKLLDLIPNGGGLELSLAPPGGDSWSPAAAPPPAEDPPPILSLLRVVTSPPTSQKRDTAVAVVGWPPVRAFRRNLAGKGPASAAEAGGSVSAEKAGLFVKINMDGVPIGRKVDLKACGGYQKLSSAIDELFGGLLAAQREKKEALTGLLDGSGEYTLVYEDEEGDKLLVGDVPWEMFVSSVKRLRVLKSSELLELPARCPQRGGGPTVFGGIGQKTSSRRHTHPP